VLLQLLVYSETVPFVVKRLGGDRKKIRASIAVGSFLPLLMCIMWTAAAVCAAPYSPAAFDPVQALLGASQSKSLRLCILTLAASAITTTAIGSLLTTSQFFQDALTLRRGRAALARTLAIVPCTLIAALGSRSLYYYATAFAGMFPVLLLWGLFPPLAFLRLRRGQKTSSDGVGGGVEVALARVNVIVSLAVLSVNLRSFFL
jgi:tyrosine-specific transport protein